MPRAAAPLVTIVFVATMALSVRTGVLVPVVATVLVIQVMLATAPAPSEAPSLVPAAPSVMPALLGGAVAAAIALHPPLLLGAATRSSLDGLQPGAFGGLALGVAAGQLAAMVSHVARRDLRTALVRSLAATASLTIFAGCATGWISAARAVNGQDVVEVSCAGAAAGLLVWALSGPRPLVGVVSLAVGAGTACAASFLPGNSVPWSFSLAAGAAITGLAEIGLSVGAVWAKSGRNGPAWGFPAALGIALAGPAVFLAGDFLTALT